MTKYVVAQNGVVINIVTAPPADANVTFWWAVADSQVVSVGDAFDPKQFQYDAADVVAGQVLFNHENRLRDIVRAIRDITSTVSGAQAANAEGLPTTAQSQDITGAQFKNAVLSLLPAQTALSPPHYLITSIGPQETIIP